jgi:hypothetical protein
MDGSRSEIKSIRSDLDPHKTGEPLAAGGGALDELEAAAVDEAAPPPVDVESHPFDSCRRRCSRGGVLGAASPLYLSPSQEGYRGFVPVRDREETSRKQEGYRGFVPVRFRNESTLPGARHSHFRA